MVAMTAKENCMALVLAFEDAKTNQHWKPGNVVSKGIIEGATNTPFFGSRNTPDFPQGKLTQHAPGQVTGAHFHTVDQFQVIVEGKGKLGRHDYVAYCVHFSRAYTPHGPLVSDPSTGFIHFGLRPHYDLSPQRLPQGRDQLKQMPDRRPWQITRPVIFPTLQSGTEAANVMLQAVPDIKDEQGLAAYTLRMKPNAKTYAPDPSHGDGQYVVVVKGSLLHNDKEHKAPALVFVYPKEGSFQIHAGSGGLEALVLNFPGPQTRAARAATSVQATTGFKTWQCTLCAFVYDEAAGLLEEGIAPGIRWQHVPETWTCPDCNSSKGDFKMI
jgi:rubredoxin